MKALNKKIDLFCYRHPRFGIPNLMLYIVIGNVVVWLFSIFEPEILRYLSLSPYDVLHGEVWRLVTFIIFPISDGYLAIIAFYFYYMIGSSLERLWGPGRFTIFLLTGILLTILYCFAAYFAVSLRLPADLTLPRDLELLGRLPLHIDTDFLKGMSLSGKAAAELRESLLMVASLPATASYIYLSLFFAFATMFPETRVQLFFIIPVRMKWLAIIDAVVFGYTILVTCAAGEWLMGLLPVVALLNYLLFCGEGLFRWMKPPAKQQRQNTTNFRQEVRRIQYEEKTRPYTRKCEVCGRTDTDHPDLEFRYCSRCQGYHCFCIDHINAHRHFSE